MRERPDSSDIKYIYIDKQTVIDFEEFELKMKKDYNQIKKLLNYINNIKNEQNIPNYNVIKCFHLFIIKFLNSFGHDYQRTSQKKYENLLIAYKNITIKRSFTKFLERNKILKEFKKDLHKLGLPKKEILKIQQKENIGK